MDTWVWRESEESIEVEKCSSIELMLGNPLPTVRTNANRLLRS